MRRRNGFTIIELLVSMALVIFIMAILAEAFVAGLTTFRNMKAVGDMNARLRTATSMMRDDLRADHFEGDRRLSDPMFWTVGPPQEGYFRLWHGTQLGAGATYYNEGTADGIDSYYATDHFLQFTAKKRGNNRGDYYSATVPVGSFLLNLGTPDSRYQETTVPVYTSQWAEIAYFMRLNGGSSAGGLPLYTLFRRQKAVVPSTIVTGTTTDLNYQWVPPIGNNPASGLPLTFKPYYLELSTSVSAQGTLYFNSPRDLTIPERRFGMNQLVVSNNPRLTVVLPYHAAGAPSYRYPIFALNSPSYVSPNYLPDDEDNAAAIAGNGNSSLSSEGNDVILTDVISFAVIPIFLINGVPTPSPNFVDQNPVLGNINYFPSQASLFDTWSNRADDVYDYTLWNDTVNSPSNVVPNTSVLTGLQISIRVWDAKTNQARQITMMVDL